MALRCTLYCLEHNPEQILTALNSLSVSLEVEQAEQSDWLAFRYQSKNCTLICRNIGECKTDIGASELRQSTATLVQSITSGHTMNQTALRNHIENCATIYAIEAEPEFDEVAEDILFKLAEIANGVIFTGDEFLNVYGGLILDIQGNSDEGIAG